MTSQSVLIKSLWWKIYNGSSIHIWTDPWLASFEFQVVSLIQLQASEMMSDSISHVSIGWNAQVIKENFFAIEA